MRNDFKSITKHVAFLRAKPGVIARILKDVFRKNILRQNVLRTVDFAITGDCHYKCSFCSAYRLYKKGGPYLTVGQIRNIWQECVKLGAIHINLTGGEPLLRGMSEVGQIIRNLNPSGFIVSLVTNAVGLNEKKIDQLKEAGLDTLQFSIESADPARHDKLVGVPGNYDKVIQGTRYARRRGLRVCWNVVYFNGNTGEVRKLIDLSAREGAFLVLNIASAEGRWGEKETVRLKKEEEKIFDEFMCRSHVRHDSSANFDFRRGCPGGKERIHITAYGDVLTCPLVQISYGNVLKEPLKEIYKRMNDSAVIKKHYRTCKHAFSEEHYEKLLGKLDKFAERPVSISRL